jgi:hypothetical protein
VDFRMLRGPRPPVTDVSGTLSHMYPERCHLGPRNVLSPISPGHTTSLLATRPRNSGIRVKDLSNRRETYRRCQGKKGAPREKSTTRPLRESMTIGIQPLRAMIAALWEYLMMPTGQSRHVNPPCATFRV